MGIIPFNTPLWFLPCLFLITMIYYFIKKHIQSTTIIIFILIVLSSIGFKTINSPILPWTADSALYYLLFYGVGNIVGEKNIKLGIVLKYMTIISAFVINVTLLVKPYLLKALISDYPFISKVIIAFSGMFVFWYIAYKIQGSPNISKIFKYFGINSLIILAVHIPLREYVVGIIIWSVTGSFYDGVGIRLINIVSSLILCVPSIYIINNYFPHLIGKSVKKII